MRSKLALLLVLMLSSLFAEAQLSNLSPYSRFGLGDLYQGGNVGTFSLGGSRTAFNDRYMINGDNPATYGYLFNTTFQASARIQQLRLTQGDATQELSGGNLDQFLIGFKRGNAKTGFVLGVTPYSTSGYSISSEITDDIGDITYSYEGNGGINKAFVGAGRKFDIYEYRYWRDNTGVAYDSLKVVKHSFGFGANVNYFFGNISQTRIVDYDDVTFIDTRAIRNTRLSDAGVEIGAYYEGTLKATYDKDKRLISRSKVKAGLTYSPSIEMNTRLEETIEQTITNSGVIFPLDTSLAIEGRGISEIPDRLRYGLGYEYLSPEGRTFAAYADFEQRDWSSYRTVIDDEEITPELANSSELTFGFSFTPRQIDDEANVLAKTQYRIGMRTADTYYVVNNEQITDQAVSLGFSMPMISSRSASKFHFGMEFGTRGVNDGVLLKEDYLNIMIGVTLTPYFRNAWFVQRKYD
ncbi:hypothetical protein [Sanyastnella coralliicola]|uniref:hypothetical protein n=1 Tax=Sanyastnella coralliicola TaxID=3069118 RepID=UPI0027BB0F98|nr:hypothetical protein [Longitalea sp. SCSIO 12813]